ncbi:MAG: ATP synthase F0 subunit B [Burkholderiales bacterium]|nr:ATP synthase F0 subunit B [Burkholderiales bacterium]
MEIIHSVLHSLGFDPVVFGSQVLLFYVMHLLLQRILYRPLEHSRDQREALTMGRVDEAERINQQALALKENYEDEIRRARQAAQAAVQQARSQAEADRVARLAAARAEAEALLRTAKEEILGERTRAEAELNQQVAELSMAVAGRLVETMAGPAQRERVLKRLREASS